MVRLSIIISFRLNAEVLILKATLLRFAMNAIRGFISRLKRKNRNVREENGKSMILI